MGCVDAEEEAEDCWIVGLGSRYTMVAAMTAVHLRIFYLDRETLHRDLRKRMFDLSLP